MANIFKTTLKNNFISIPFIIAAFAALFAGGFDVVFYIVDYDGYAFSDSRLMESHMPTYLAFLIAALPPLLTGREFVGGTIRNKLITGTTKTGFFISQLLVNSAITVIIAMLYFLPTFIFCTKYYDHFQPYMVFYAIVFILLGYLVITAISTVISVMSDRMIVSMVASLLLLFIFVFVDSWLGNSLSQPKYQEGFDQVYYEGGIEFESNEYDEEYQEYQGSQDEKYKDYNPYYVKSKAQRAFMQTARHLIPFEIIGNGTAMIEEQLVSMDMYRQSKKEAAKHADDYPVFQERVDSLFWVPVYSISFIAVLTALGLFLFKRRNIK